MKTIERQAVYNAPISEVFEKLDDLGVTGTHMTKSSAMMMGNKLTLTYLSKNHAGLNSKYRWQGRMMGIPMDFTVLVTKWIQNQEKIWETIGHPELIIYSWYRMTLQVTSSAGRTVAKLSISYKRPAGLLSKIVSFLFADLYCIWCLNNMLKDARKAIKASPEKMHPAGINS